MGGIEDSIHPKSKEMGPSPQVVFPLAFFVVNDDRKLDLYYLKPCVMLFLITFVKLTILTITPKGGKV
jgi:hypothetical protein